MQTIEDLRKRQEAIVAMGRRAAVDPSDLSILLYDAAALLAETLDTECRAVAELTAGGQTLRQRLELGDGRGREPRTLEYETTAGAHESLAGYVLQVAQPIATVELSQEKRFVDRVLRKEGVQAALAVPLKLHDRSFGALAACTAQKREFREEDILFAETIAHLVSTTLARRQAERRAAEAEQAAADSRRALIELKAAAAADSQATGPRPTAPGPWAAGALAPVPGDAHTDRRNRPRRSYPYRQQVAIVVDGRLPEPSAFMPVECNDIAAAGLSFFTRTPPTSDTVVVALGIPPRITYLIAQVAHVNRVVRTGQTMYRVGCTYVGRAQYEQPSRRHERSENRGP